MSTSIPHKAQGQASGGARAGYWGMALALLLGMTTGLGLFTFSYGEGLSYFSDDPNSCLNCHIMRDQFDAWGHSSHKAVATCNTCHTPHDFAGKWLVKGINGFNHSVAFTTGNFPEPIRIKDLNARVAQANCIECHGPLVSQMHASPAGETRACISCHGNVGHDT